MGSTLLDGWIAQGVQPDDVAIVEPGDHHGRLDGYVQKGATLVSSADRLPHAFKPTFVLMAVKPQVVGNVLGAYQDYADQGAFVISVVAGKDLSFLTSVLGQAAYVVRAMPNTPRLSGVVSRCFVRQTRFLTRRAGAARFFFLSLDRLPGWKMNP